MEACKDFVIICEHFLMRKVAAEMCLCMYIRWKLKWWPGSTFAAISEHFALEKKENIFDFRRKKVISLFMQNYKLNGGLEGPLQPSVIILHSKKKMKKNLTSEKKKSFSCVCACI